MLKSWRMLNARDPQGEAGSQGRLSTPAELMVWFTTPVLNAANEPPRAVPLWQKEHLAWPKKALKPRCCAAVITKLLKLNLFGSVPAGKSSDRMNASMAASSSEVGSRKSGSDLPLFRASVRGKCCVTAPVANDCRSGTLPLSPNPNPPNLWFRFRRCGDLRNTGAVGGKPSMFSRIRPRPWGKFAVSALVLIRFGSSRPSTDEPAMAPRLPAVMLMTVPEHELLSLTSPDKAGFMPPETRYVVGETCVSTLAFAAVAPLPLVMMPCNVPLHGAALDTVWVRTSGFRLKSKPGSKLDGFVSPMNSGSNVVETFLNRDWILLGGNAKFRLAM